MNFGLFAVPVPHAMLDFRVAGEPVQGRDRFRQYFNAYSPWYTGLKHVSGSHPEELSVPCSFRHALSAWNTLFYRPHSLVSRKA